MPIRLLFYGALVAITASLQPDFVLAQGLPHVITCGRSAVVESEITIRSQETTLTPVWTWTPESSAGMPPELIRNFSTIDECKPTNGGSELLVTSSHDAVALISRKDGKTLFSAAVKNAHSAVLLPNDILAVASSDAKDGTGDRVVFFDRHTSNVRLAEQPLHAAHGLVWDERHKLLWADGWDELLGLQVVRDQAGDLHLAVKKRFQLPEAVGHDLRIKSDCSALYMSTTHHVYQFPMATERFEDFRPLGETVDVKSLSIDPESGWLVYTIADPGGYWTSTLRFENPHRTATLPAPIYKTRWVTDLPPTCAANPQP